jgi:hypothetical protein
MNARLVFLACGWLVAGSDIMATSSSLSPEAVVQSQVDAYNARNLEAFLATYTDAARLYEWPDKLLAAGTAQLRERYASRFAEAGLHADILQRIVVGNLVVDHEKVRRMFPEGPGTLEAIAIYEVQNGKIAKAWLRLGERRFDRDAIR